MAKKSSKPNPKNTRVVRPPKPRNESHSMVTTHMGNYKGNNGGVSVFEITTPGSVYKYRFVVKRGERFVKSREVYIKEDLVRFLREEEGVKLLYHR